MERVFEFDGEIRASEIGKGGAYVIFPYDIKSIFGKGRLKVKAYFDDVEYTGSVVNMGVKDEEGNPCYILGVLKEIRKKTGKDIGDFIHVKVEPIL